ncbi:MAG: RNA polymerase factor sigma-54 [Planctomycetota bacterium]
MRFDTSQHMRLGQQMKLSPRVIQSMEILQMPLADLEQRIEEELESNMALEVVEKTTDGRDRRDADQTDRPDRELAISDNNGSADDFARLDSFQADQPDAADNAFEGTADGATLPRDAGLGTRDLASRRLSGERDGKMDAMAAAPARQASVSEQLQEQWSLAEMDGELRTLGEYLISFIDEDGYVRTPLDEIAERAPEPVAELTGGRVKLLEQLPWVLEEVQLVLEPAGVAARDARECLLLQLDAVQNDPDFNEDDQTDDAIEAARWLVADHLDDLMNNRLPRIADKTTLTMDEIKGGVQLLRRLSLAPGKRLAPDRREPIIPDAIVEFDEDNDRYIAYLNDRSTMNLRINREYAEMVRTRELDKQGRDFVRKNLSNAQWLVDAIGQRRDTLLRVIHAVLDAQRDYFDYGPESLKPLPMTQVAEQLGIHVATVSRAVSDKHLQTPRGVVPLRRFFTGGTQNDQGDDVSWDAIKAALSDVVEKEDKAKPLSDEAIVRELKKRGVEIARRTVAKYRDQLGIPSARLRKTY